MARFARKPAAAARVAQAVSEAYEIAEAQKRKGAGEARWLGDVQSVAHSYGMAFSGGGYAISFLAAAALAEINGSWTGASTARYNELYGSEHCVRPASPSSDDRARVPPEWSCFYDQEANELDLKGHVYGLLAAHPVAPLHHLDRLSRVSF
ncbi:hypothetical protein BAE44_0014979 [Dichanthelium oligosanthes]|uniref:Uncharacterized protein n=1 Tax=Dichanthelium oligosanthes TaxID=888268 RepID=A0A1E5VFW2_9POAL|nr:hypothetical protein BAE44_0014979 [Dichanthelium oligosanthes]